MAKKKKQPEMGFVDNPFDKKSKKKRNLRNTNLSRFLRYANRIFGRNPFG